MKCLLTGATGKGVRAHIIPRSFYALDYSQGAPLEVITNSANGYDGKSFVGIYDTTIVTLEGEKCFSPWDDYANELLIENRKNFVEHTSEGKIVGLEAKTYDYKKLKLFFLSVLWRASVSSQPFFQRVNLGPHESLLRERLLNEDPGDEEAYSVSLACFIDMPTRTAMLDPFKARDDGITHYRFYLGHYIAYIKVDKRPTPPLFQRLMLSPNASLNIVCREFQQSKELGVMRRLANERK